MVMASTQPKGPSPSYQPGEDGQQDAAVATGLDPKQLAIAGLVMWAMAGMSLVMFIFYGVMRMGTFAYEDPVADLLLWSIPVLVAIGLLLIAAAGVWFALREAR